MKKLLLFTLVLIAFSGSGFSQELPVNSVNANQYRNSVYLELFGNGLIGSLNYERIFGLPKANSKCAFRVGGIFLPEGRDGDYLDYTMVLPVELSLIWGDGFWKPEAGFGITYFGNSDYYGGEKPDKTAFLIPALRFGLRFNKPGSPFFGRCGITPLFFLIDQSDSYIQIPPVLPWAGVSLGYSFGKRPTKSNGRL
jgi:hypothetical protein